MSDNNQFTETPKSKGYSVAKVSAIVGTIFVVCGGVLLYALMQSPIQQSAAETPDAEPETTKPVAASSSQDLDVILNKGMKVQASAAEAIKESQVTEVDKKDVPPIQNTATNGQVAVDPALEDYRKQVQQIGYQSKIKRLQDQVAAYGSKASLNIGASSSSPISDTPHKAIASGTQSASNSQNKMYSQSKLMPVRSKYELKAGSVIPCVLLTSINSEISGPVIAMVSENVYDSVSGRYLVLPQGTKILGDYDGRVPVGGSRLAIAFQRATYPDGDTLDLEGIPGSDLTGANGLSGDVNNHYWQMFGTSFIMGVINYGQTAAGSVGNGDSLTSSTGQSVGQSAQSSIAPKLNVSPTITIPGGASFNIMVMKDFILKAVN